MPTKFFEELIGKECDITMREDEYETATLLAVDGEWLKLRDDDGKTIYANARQIISITVEEERTDRETRRGRRRR